MKAAALRKSPAPARGGDPLLRATLLEMHRLELDSGSTADELADWVREVRPNFIGASTDSGIQRAFELRADKGLRRLGTGFRGRVGCLEPGLRLIHFFFLVNRALGRRFGGAAGGWNSVPGTR